MLCILYLYLHLWSDQLGGARVRQESPQGPLSTPVSVPGGLQYKTSDCFTNQTSDCKATKSINWLANKARKRLAKKSTNLGHCPFCFVKFRLWDFEATRNVIAKIPTNCQMGMQIQADATFMVICSIVMLQKRFV